MRTDAHRFRVALLTLTICSIALVRASAEDPLKQIIVRCTPEELAKIRSRHGAAIVDAVPRSGLYLLAANSKTQTSEILATGKTVVTSPNLNVAIRDPFQKTNARGSVSATTVNFYTSNAPSLYVSQPATQRIGAVGAHRYRTGRRTLIALIDTGIDENHPVLRNSIVRGRNFVVPSTNTSEWNDPTINQSEASVFDLLQSQASAFDLDQSQASVFDLDLLQGRVGVFMRRQSRAVLSSAQLPGSFGHGTMVAGVVHLVAPEALLMPMKAFDANGSGSLWNVANAIREAVEMGADVINMSFSSAPDPETVEFLRKVALDYARESNVALVASAGNSNSETPVPPASFESVVAVAALNPDDTKASFSNYGRHIDVSAPGTDIITTYPGTFAIVSGTSFSAPFVSGLFALLKEMGVDGVAARTEIENTADPINALNPQFRNKLGVGRINVLKAVSKRRIN